MEQVKEGDAGGYPAWAGIDRIAFLGAFWARRLPRVGGDRPAAIVGRENVDAVTPRGRG